MSKIRFVPGQHGFQMDFHNGLTLSIQYGAGNYHESRSFAAGGWDTKHEDLPSTHNFEMAVIKDNVLLQLLNDTVAGWIPFSALPEIMHAMDLPDEDSVLSAIREIINATSAED